MYKPAKTEARIKHLIFTGVLAILLMMPFSAFASVWEVKVAVANLRVAPAINAPLVTQLSQGEKVELLAKQGEWLQVRLSQGTKAWVHQGGVSQLTENAASSRQEVLRLSNFSAASGSVKLQGSSKQFELFLPLAETRKVEAATLSLRLVSSIALQAKRSFMLVRFNETTLAQIPFNPNQPISDARVRLPAELWRGGFNKLTLEVTQHYADRCEDATAPELWTEVDLYNSQLELTHSEEDKELSLGDLSAIFSPGIGGFSDALLVTPATADGSVKTGQVYSEALPLVAQALALRRQYAELKLEHQAWSFDDQPSTKNTHAPFYVVLGTSSELSKLLSSQQLEAIQGPYLQLEKVAAIKNNLGEPLAPSGIRLLVSGKTEAEVLAAARLLIEMDDRLNPVPSITLLERHQANEALPLASGKFLNSGQSYTFAALGATSQSFQNLGQNRMSVNLPIPADFYAVESDFAELQLDFGYGAGMGIGSVMNVYLNGEYLHGLLLNEPNGAAFSRYLIQLPVRKLTPGINNQLEFDITLRPELAVGECTSLAGSHLIFQIQGSSSISLPSAGSVAMQPDLALLGATSFPYVSSSSKAPTDLLVESEALTASALTLIGRMAQTAKAPLETVRLQMGLNQHPTGQALLLATPEALPESLFAEWDAALGRTQVWPYIALNDLRASLNSGESFSWPSVKKNEDSLAGKIHQQGGLGSLGVIASFRNPYVSENATLTLVTAQTETLLQDRLADLVTDEIWSQLKGDLFVWRANSEEVVSMQVAKHYVLGEEPSWLKLRMLLSYNPWYWLAALVLLLVISSFIAVKLLRRRKTVMENI